MRGGGTGGRCPRHETRSFVAPMIPMTDVADTNLAVPEKYNTKHWAEQQLAPYNMLDSVSQPLQSPVSGARMYWQLCFTAEAPASVAVGKTGGRKPTHNASAQIVNRARHAMSRVYHNERFSKATNRAYRPMHLLWLSLYHAPATLWETFWARLRYRGGRFRPQNLRKMHTTRPRVGRTDPAASLSLQLVLEG